MNDGMPHASAAVRRGITLLEVLISIGILAIGLASVVALVPAGQSQASRAVVLDRGALLAANVLADTVTFGLTGSAALTSGNVRPVVIDSLGSVLNGGRGGNIANGNVGSMGMYSIGASGAAASTAYLNTFLQLRDDLVFDAPATPDDLPGNAFIDGVRGFDGRMSALVCLQSGTPGGPHLMSVVVLHGRDPLLTTLTGILTSGTLVIPSTQAASLGNRLVTDVIKPGMVVFSPATRQFHRLTAARIGTISPVSQTADGTYNAWMSFSTGMAITTSTTPVTLQFLPDSIGLAERPFMPETGGRFTQ